MYPYFIAQICEIISPEIFSGHMAGPLAATLLPHMPVNEHN